MTSSTTSGNVYYSMSVVHAAQVLPLSCLYFGAYTVIQILTGRPKVRALPPTTSTTNTTTPSSRRRVAVITGANTGIGLETSKRLVVEHGMDVVLACRSRDKAEQAVQEINQLAAARNSKGRAHFYHPCDLTNFQSIQAFSRVLHEVYASKNGIDVLINNAGLNGIKNQGEKTVDDCEIVFQANTLGHVLLTNLLLGLLTMPASNADGHARIVNLSSVVHHFVGNYNFGEVSYWQTLARNCQHGHDAYNASKLASILFTLELNRRYFDNNNKTISPSGGQQQRSIRSFAVNPGAVHSDLWRVLPSMIQYIMGWIFLSPQQGCSTTVAAAVGDFAAANDDDVYYLQPYWLPWWWYGTTTTTPVHPVLEMIGPYVGYQPARPRLPQEPLAAQDAFLQVCQEVTGCQFSSS